MARIKVQINGKPLGTVQVDVRITDLNYGNHVGNDAMVGIIHEARMQWLAMHGFTELDMAGTSLIMAGLSVEFVNESFYRNRLTIHLSAGMITSAGFELYYDVRCLRDGVEQIICRARTDMVCFDYVNRKVKALPEKIRKILS